MMPVPMMQPIPSPTPIKPNPKRGFSIDEIVGSTAMASPPKYQSLSPSLVVKPETHFNYPFLPRTDVGMFLDSVSHYSQMFSSLPPELRANLDCLGLTYPRVHIPQALSLVGREMQPVNPWYTNRHARYYHPRLQGPDSASYLYHPFRKPKRVRTAFSPSQLLQLEHAFEKNHYMVGSERRQLAEALNLTETQVKVWFQNRRTKYKRQKQDDDQSCEDKGGDSREHSSSSDDETSARDELQERNSAVNDETQLWNSADAKVPDLSNLSYTTQYAS